MKKQKTAEKQSTSPTRRRQKCVIQGLLIKPDEAKGFEKWFEDEWGYRIEYVTQYKTLPDTENGYDVEGTGGRSDIIFYLHKDDVLKMVVERIRVFKGDIKWWEDHFDNNHNIIPEEILNTNLKFS